MRAAIVYIDRIMEACSWMTLLAGNASGDPAGHRSGIRVARREG